MQPVYDLLQEIRDFYQLITPEQYTECAALFEQQLAQARTDQAEMGVITSWVSSLSNLLRFPGNKQKWLDLLNNKR